MKSDKFCPMPFGSMIINPDGKLFICCSDRGPMVDENGKDITIHTHTIDQAWNSKHYQKVRLEFLEGKQPDTCVECWVQEIGKNGRSTRTGNVELYERYVKNGFNIKNAIDEAKANNGVLKKSKPIDFQVMSGNLCNLACKMCFPRYSNSWSKFYKNKDINAKELKYHRNVISPANLNDAFEHIYDWPKTVRLDNIFSNNVDDLYHINLTGGEPTLLPENIDFLEFVKTSKNLKNFELTLITNTTNINENLLKALDGFSRINLISSLDGMDDIAYIQRTPSNWSQIFKNLTRLRNFSLQKINQCHHGVNSVVTALNLHHVGYFWNYLVSEKNLKWDANNISAAFVVSNEYPVGLEIVPKNVIKKIKKEFESYSSLRNSHLYYTMMDYFENTVWAENNTLMLEMLETVQRLHPELDIPKIYKIYYE